MCDTLVVVPEGGPVWLAKNSDREPGEAQIVEHRPPAAAPPGLLRATWISIAESAPTLEVALSRPVWMWGAEMGVNASGVAIGNEAVFTRIPVADTGLTGMDLVRLALERCRSADEALDFMTFLLARHGQGGRAGYRSRLRYHNAFLLADPRGAWLLETAGPYWAADRVRGHRSTSNVLTLDEEPERVGPGTREVALARGWLRRGEPLSFRRAFGRPEMAFLSGGDVRRRRTAFLSAGARSVSELADTLRDHGGRAVHEGLRMTAPCAHAAPLPTRTSGQTTGSLIARLSPDAPTAFFTGTSAPCLSVFKPIPWGAAPLDAGPTPPQSGADGESLFWRGERLHRAVLRDCDARRGAFEAERAELEARSLATRSPAEIAEVWSGHRDALPRWTELALRRAPTRRATTFDAYWAVESWRDRV